MADNDPSSSSTSESDDFLLNSVTDQASAIEKAIRGMEIINLEQIQRTDNFVTSKFCKSADLLSNILLYIIEQKSSEKKPDMLQCLTKHSIEHQIINIYCKVCVETLETSDKAPKSVIPLEHLEVISNALHFLINISNDNSEICSAISKQPNVLEVLTKRLVDCEKPHSIQPLDKVCS
jgi:predicted nucleic acid-binding protein